MNTISRKICLLLLATLMILAISKFAMADTGSLRIDNEPGDYGNETPLLVADFAPVKNPPSGQTTESTTEKRDTPHVIRRTQSEDRQTEDDSAGTLDIGAATRQRPDLGGADLDSLMDQFMNTGKAIEGRPGGTDSVDSDWFDALVVTKADNPMLERSCRRDALQSAVDRLAEAKGIEHKHSAIAAAREHMQMHQTFIKENGISYADYLKSVAECTKFCAPLIASLMHCHILSVGKYPRGIVVFEFDSHEIDPRYTDGMLEIMAERLHENKNLNVLLEGRASKIGGLRYNRRLAGQRALAVSDQFRLKGISRERIKTMWFGWEPPQIDETVARQYGIEGLYEQVGTQDINQSVMIVLYPENDATVAQSETDG